MRKHFHIVVPVWGERYTMVFTNTILPLLMANNNLGSFPINEWDKFVIVTRWENALAIQESASFQQLKSILPVTFIVADGLVNFKSSYVAMSQCYALAMQAADVIPGKTFFMFLTPDCFWTPGTLKRVYELRESEFKVVMAMGLRTTSDTMIPLLQEWIQADPKLRQDLSVDYFINLAINHLHPLSNAMDVLSTRNQFVNEWPANLYWISRKDNQIIGHCFHLHPLMIQAPPSDVSIGNTIDGDFLHNLNYPLETFHVLTQDFFCIDLTDPKRRWEWDLEPVDLDKVIKFSILHANDQHMHFFQQRVILSESNFVPLELESLITTTVKKVVESRAAYFKTTTHSAYRIKKICLKLFNKTFKTIYRFTVKPVVKVMRKAREELQV